MKKYVNQIFIVLISILLIISSMVVTNFKYLQIAGYSLVIIYIIIRFIQKKPIKIVKSKLDVFVILFAISTIMPILFNKYVSLYGTVKTILEYTYVLCIYILLREIMYDNKGLSKIITNVLIISAVFLIFIGIDAITVNTSQNLFKILNKDLVQNEDNRLVSTFCYPNAFAAYIASIIFLNINEYLRKDKKTIKALYKTITFILTVGIILTYSKGIFLILPVLMIAYIIFLKDKKHKIEVIQNVLISLIMGVMYINAFEQLFSLYYDQLICVLLGIMIVINYIINILVEQINTYIVNINFKKVSIFFAVAILICIIYVVIGLNIYDKYEVFKEDVTSNYKVKIINNIKRKYRVYVRI